MRGPDGPGTSLERAGWQKGPPFKRPWLQRSIPAQGVSVLGPGAGPRKEREFKPCEDGVGGSKWGEKAELTHPCTRTPHEHACDGAPGPVEGWGGGKEEEKEEEAGAAPEPSCSSALFVLRPRSPRGEPGRVVEGGGRDGSGSWDPGTREGRDARCGGVWEGGAGMLNGMEELGTWTCRLGMGRRGTEPRTLWLSLEANKAGKECMGWGWGDGWGTDLKDSG